MIGKKQNALRRQNEIEKYHKSHYSSTEKILIYRSNEFKNVCLMAKKVFYLSISNSKEHSVFC